jgi:hypothetical protein
VNTEIDEITQFALTLPVEQRAPDGERAAALTLDVRYTRRGWI